MRSNIRELLSTIHLFCKEGQWFCFHKESNRLFKLTNREASIIQDLIRHPGEVAPESKDVLDYISSELGHYRPTIRDLEPLNTFYLRLNRRCNLHCSYCHAISGETQDSTVINPKLAALATTTMWDLGAKGVGVHGGEPFVDWKKTLEVLKAIRKAAPEIDIGLTCNGTLINPDIATWLQRIGVIVSVELDGSKKVHDRFKSYDNGNSSYYDALAGAKMLKEYGLLAAIESTVSGLEGYDVDGYQYLHSLFPDTPIIISRIKDRSPVHWVSHGEDLMAFLTQQKEYVESIETVMNDAVAGLINISSDPIMSKYRCVCLLDKVSINIDGAVYICPKEESERTFIGMITDDDFKSSFWEKRESAAKRFSSNPLESYWFSDLIEYCIDSTFINNDGYEEIQDKDIFGRFFEDLLFLSVKTDPSVLVERWTNTGF